MNTRIVSLIAAVAALVHAGFAATNTIHIDAGAPGIAVSPTMHGVFFEDINYGADGGLYAELVQNRSFEHKDHLFGWTNIGTEQAGVILIGTNDPVHPNNPNYLRLIVSGLEEAGLFGAVNSGYDGIPVSAGESFRISLQARTKLSLMGQDAQLIARLEDAEGQVLGGCALTGLGPEWQELQGTIQTTGTTARARLLIAAPGGGQYDMDVVSLMPENTWKQRTNGMRADLAQLLADMKPGFLRFPGGCIVEGRDLPNAYRWKDTIGGIHERKQNWNRWQDAMRGAKFPHYYQTYGLGFFEYFQLCEDLGAEAVPILNCGMSCQYQDKELVPLDQLDPWVQDALDLVEFANGDTNSVWGSKRAEMGHPAPFNLKYLGIGNEQWDEVYFKRYLVFHKALKAKYPDLQIISTAGPSVDEKRWKSAWDRFRGGTPADIVDEHYYRPPQWFLDNTARYDRQDRKGPKVFAGEFAAHEPKGKRNTLRSAIAEAAFMTGLLRNADLVVMAAYAPLFAKVGYSQWQPNLIWFDNTRAYGTPSYYVQALYSQNRPDVVVPTEVKTADTIASGTNAATPSVFAVAGRDRQSGEIILDVANVSTNAAAVEIRLSGVKRLAPEGRALVLTSASPDDENSFDEPRKVSPREERVPVSASGFTLQLPAHSFTVLRLEVNN